MTLNATWLCLLAALPAAGVPRTDAATPTPPNFVVIVVDDFGYADLGSYGSTFYETPNIDRLAAAGLRFTDGYAACPVCSPTRAALMTGRYPARLNLTDWLPGRRDRPDQKLARPEIRQELPLEEVTVAEALRPAGYVAASVGKWHLGAEPYWPEHQGFDLNVGGTQTGSPPGGYFRFQTPSLQARDPEEYLTDRLTEEAIRFIESNRDRPFLLYLPHYTVHIPLQAREELVEKYRQKAAGGVAGPQDNAIYAAMIESLDLGVGQIMRTLRELELAERTVVVFTSDNGGLSVQEGPNTPATSNDPLRAGKGYLYEGGIRVPWIVAWPGTIEAGRVCNVPISSIDLLPTLLDLAGVDPPEGRAIDGVSLRPLLEGAGTLDRETLFWHYPHYSNQGGKPGGVIRRGPHKLIEFYEDGRLELYDLARDLDESDNLVMERPELAVELQAELDAWRRSVDARMMTPNPNYRPDAPARKAARKQENR